MAQDNKVHIPSGQGGLVRFSNESVSKLQFSPGAILVMCLIITILVILLNYFGANILN